MGPQGLWSEGLDSVPAVLGEGSPAPFSAAGPPPLGAAGVALLALHVPVGTHLHSLPQGPPPTQPCAHAADVAVVSRPQRCSSESGHPVLCGYRSRTVGGGQRPLQTRTVRGLFPSPSGCSHACTQAGGHQGGCSEASGTRAVHPSVQAPLRAERRGGGRGCGLPSPYLSSHLQCFTPEHGHQPRFPPSGEVLPSFAFSCQNHIPTGGVGIQPLAGRSCLCL